MIDGKDWLAVMFEARKRNEERIWEKHPYEDDQEFLLLRDVLVEIDMSATKAAHLAARKAYIVAYKQAYDLAHREAYDHWSSSCDEDFFA
jgi:hypothetical protein